MEENLSPDHKQMSDQAESLRKLMENRSGTSQPFMEQAEKLIQSVRNKRLLTFASSKVGLGHSTILANLAIALAEDNDKNLLIIEAREFHEQDNVHDIYNIMDITPTYDFTQVLSNKIPLEKAIAKGNYENMSILVSSQKDVTEDIVYAPEDMSQQITDNVEKLCDLFDSFIIDVGPVYNSESIEKIALTNDLITIVTPSNHARTHCYTMLKSLIESNRNVSKEGERTNETLGLPGIRLITNLVANDNQAEQVNTGIATAVERFLNTDIEVLGNIPIDINVIEATREYTPFISSYPETPASVAVYTIAKKLKDDKNNITITELKNVLTKLFTLKLGGG